MNEIAFASIVQARPCPTFGRPVHLRGSPHRLRPGTSPRFHLTVDTPSDILEQRLQIRLVCLRLSLSCPYRLLHTFHSLRPAKNYPHLRIWRSSFERQRDFNPPEQRAARRTLWRDLTSPTRASSATAPRLPDAGRPPMRAVKLEISRFPNRELLCMPGPSTTPSCGHSRKRTQQCCLPRCRLCRHSGVSTYAAQFLACTFPDRRFACSLTAGHARLAANVDRSTFFAVDFHHLLPAGLPARRQVACDTGGNRGAGSSAWRAGGTTDSLKGIGARTI
jgi:hypothetical protein